MSCLDKYRADSGNKEPDKSFEILLPYYFRTTSVLLPYYFRIVSAIIIVLAESSRAYELQVAQLIISLKRF